jgi:hypothetical protein
MRTVRRLPKSRRGCCPRMVMRRLPSRGRPATAAANQLLVILIIFRFIFV